MSYTSSAAARIKAIWRFLRKGALDTWRNIRSGGGGDQRFGREELESTAQELRTFNKVAQAFVDQHQAQYIASKTDEERTIRVAKWSLALSGVATVFAFLAALGTVASALYAQRQLFEARTDTELQRQLNKVIFIVNFDKSVVEPGSTECNPMTRICDHMPSTQGDAFNVGDLTAPIIAHYTHFNFSASMENIGHAVENVDYADIRFYIANELPKLPSYSSYFPQAPSDPDLKPGPYVIVDVDFGSSDKGQSIKFREDLTIKEFTSIRNIASDGGMPIFSRLAMGKDLNFFVYGRVGYTDQFDIRREFGFAQKLSHATQVWSRTGNNSYNYDRIRP